MRIELGNKLEEMAKAMTALAEFTESVGLELREAQITELVLDELLNNVISYGYRDAAQHTITVELCVDGNSLQMVVSDDGIPFNPFLQEDPDLSLPLEKRKLGGIGIYLVKKFMDECSYQRHQGRNVVTLVKSIGESSTPST